jgi:hypothetical protein
MEDVDVSGNPCLTTIRRGKRTQCTHSITTNTTVVTQEPYPVDVDAHGPQLHALVVACGEESDTELLRKRK